MAHLENRFPLYDSSDFVTYDKLNDEDSPDNGNTGGGAPQDSFIPVYPTSQVETIVGKYGDEDLYCQQLTGNFPSQAGQIEELNSGIIGFKDLVYFSFMVRRKDGAWLTGNTPNYAGQTCSVNVHETNGKVSAYNAIPDFLSCRCKVFVFYTKHINSAIL